MSIIVRPPFDVCQELFPHQVNCDTTDYIKCGSAYCPFKPRQTTPERTCGTWLGQPNFCCYTGGAGIYPTCDEIPGLVEGSIETFGNALAPTDSCSRLDDNIFGSAGCCPKTNSVVELYGTNEEVSSRRCYPWDEESTESPTESSPSPTASDTMSQTSSSSSTSTTPNNAVKKSVSWLLGSVAVMMMVTAQL